MTFKEAFKLMKNGTPMKLPSWGGYWVFENNTIMMHCREKDSETGKSVLDIRETQRVEYTIENILSDEWEEATEENCTLLGGTPTFGFGKACEYIKRGIPVKRKGRTEIYVATVEKPLEVEITVEDMKARDWCFAE